MSKLKSCSLDTKFWTWLEGGNETYQLFFFFLIPPLLINFIIPVVFVSTTSLHLHFSPPQSLSDLNSFVTSDNPPVFEMLESCSLYLTTNAYAEIDNDLFLLTRGESSWTLTFCTYTSDLLLSKWVSIDK